MTISEAKANYLDTVACAVVANYSPARRQLLEWTAEHRSQVFGAAPSTTRSPVQADDEAVVLTSVERQAMSHDDAARHLGTMRALLSELAVDGRSIWAEVDGVAMPEPAHTEAADMAVMMWTVRRVGKDRHALTNGALGAFERRLVLLDNICCIHLPPPATTIIDACHAHEAANIGVEVDKRYRRHHLCDWCGKFRALHGVNPPPMLVRLHDRGIKMTATLLKRAGVKAGAA